MVESNDRVGAGDCLDGGKCVTVSGVYHASVYRSKLKNYNIPITSKTCMHMHVPMHGMYN